MLLKAWAVSSTVTRKLSTELHYLRHNMLKATGENVPEYQRAQIYDCNTQKHKKMEGEDLCTKCLHSPVIISIEVGHRHKNK